MLRNKIIVKKIRNIVILLMAIMIMLGVYFNIRNSKAENVIEISMEVLDKSGSLEMQTIMMEATETSDGNYLLDLPTSVNGNIVTKYYTSSGEEITVDVEDNTAILQLTETEVTERKLQVQTDYDKKEVTVNNGDGTEETRVLYNKELKNEDENVVVTGYMPLDSELEVSEIDLGTLTNVKLPSETQTMQKAYEMKVFEIVPKQTTEETANTAENEATVEEETNTAENEATVDEETNTAENEATVDEATDTVENEATVEEETNTVENEATVDTVENEATVDEATNTIENEATVYEETEKVEYDPSVYEETLNITIKYQTVTDTTTEEVITIYDLAENNEITEIESTVEEKTEEGETIQKIAKFTAEKATAKYIVATEKVEKKQDEQQDTTQDQTQNTTENTGDGEIAVTTTEQTATKIEKTGWKIIDSKTDAINGISTLTLKAPEDVITEEWIKVIVDGQETTEGITKEISEPKTVDGGVEYIITVKGFTQDINQVKIKIEQPTSGRKTYSSNTLKTQQIQMAAMLSASTPDETTTNDSALSGSTTGSVEADDSGIMLLATTYNALKTTSSETSPTSGFLGNTNIQRQYIESITFQSSTSGANTSTQWDVSSAGDGSIIAWYTGSSPYQVYIASDSTIYANADSRYLFAFIAEASTCTATNVITNLNLLNTSNVTNMGAMFYRFGRAKMTSLDLGDNFDTSNVTSMHSMFRDSGFTAMTTLKLGNKFDTSKVTNMTNMFYGCGSTALELIDLGPLFTKIASKNTDFVNSGTGKSGCVINCMPSIYSSSNKFKLSSSSSTTISYTTGKIVSTMLKTTKSECSADNYEFPFFGSTDFYRRDIARITFLNSTSGANSTQWDVTEVGDGSVIAWYENGTDSHTVNVYIASDYPIYANTDSSYLFADIGSSGNITSSAGNIINNIELLNTRSATKMSFMFWRFGLKKMTVFNLGDNFDTSNVTDMESMFNGCGYNSMTSFSLGSKFDTSNVTTMEGMFFNLGAHSTGMKNFSLGNYFDTSNVTTMKSMFYKCRRTINCNDISKFKN